MPLQQTPMEYEQWGEPQVLSFGHFLTPQHLSQQQRLDTKLRGNQTAPI